MELKQYNDFLSFLLLFVLIKNCVADIYYIQ